VTDLAIWGALALGVINGALMLVLLQRSAQTKQPNAMELAEKQQEQQAQLARHQALQTLINQSTDKLARDLQRDIADSSRNARQELAQNLATFQQTLVQQGAEATRTQNTQIDAFGQQLALLQKPCLTRSPPSFRA